MPALATLGALASAAYSFRFIAHVFLGPSRHDYPTTPHDPPFGFWIAPALLVVLVVVIGVQPRCVAGPLVAMASAAVIGDVPPPYTPEALAWLHPGTLHVGHGHCWRSLALAAYPPA